MNKECNILDIYTTRIECTERADRMTNQAQQRAYRTLTGMLLNAIDMYHYYRRKEPDIRPSDFAEVMAEKMDAVQDLRMLMTMVEHHFEDDTGGILQAMLPPAVQAAVLH